MNAYLVALTGAMVAAIAPSFSGPESPFRDLRLVPMLAVYPLFVVMVVTQGPRAPGLWWVALAGLGFLLILIDEAALPREKREPLLSALWKNALFWPLIIPGAAERLMIRLGVAPKPAEPRLPEPPRGAELMALSNDELLAFAYLILAGQTELTAEEETVFVAETLNREVHMGGFDQWFSNTEYSVSRTAEALRAVGADVNARLLERAGGAAPAAWSETEPLDVRRGVLEPIKSALRPLDDEFFALQRQEDLTSLVSTFVRRHRSRCPALG
jgi:hypothetical protein